MGSPSAIPSDSDHHSEPDAPAWVEPHLAPAEPVATLWLCSSVPDDDALDDPEQWADVTVALIGSPTDGWFVAAVEHDDDEDEERFHALTPVTDSPEAALAAWAPQVPPLQVAAIATSWSSTLSAEGIARMPAVDALITEVLSLDGDVVRDAHGYALVPNENPGWDGWDGWEVVDTDGPADEDDEIDVGPMAVVRGSFVMARGDVRVEVEWSEGDGWWIERAWKVEPGAS